MKLVFKNIDKDGSGCIGLVPEEPEDMWHAYNLIAEGDAVTASTVRKVQTESSTGSSTSSRVRTTLTIRVETIDFDTQACVLRLKGRNIVENQYVKMGAYHTLDLELNRKFTLQKILWDSVALERVEMACDPAASADVAAVVMQEGLAHVCLITPSMTLVRSKIDVNIPRKRKGFVQQHEKGLNKFYEAVMQGILRHVDFNVVKCVILASPGFVKDQFFDYMMQQAIKTDNKLLIENKSKFLLVKASSGFKHSLKEVLQEPAVMAKISDTKAASEVKLLESFYTMLQLEPAKAFYGKKHVERANEAMAIETLMISDKLFRCQDIAQRKEYVGLVDSARENGSDVRIFSSMHVSGEHERADELAKEAALKLRRKPDYDQYPISFIRRQIRMGSLDEWNRRYVSGETASVTKMFLPDAIAAFRIVKQVQPTGVLTQVLTGHGGFSGYLNRFKCKESPACICDPDTKLDQLTGIAAVLRFPMPELEDSDGDEENDSDSN